MSPTEAWHYLPSPTTQALFHSQFSIKDQECLREKWLDQEPFGLSQSKEAEK